MTRNPLTTLSRGAAALMLGILGMTAMTSCDDDNDTTWERYKEWREKNDEYFEEQSFKIEDGRHIYETITPDWNTSAKILIRYLNDRSKTEGNLTPMYTSTVDVKYIGRLIDGTPFDSSYNMRTNGDSIFRTSLSGVIQGWTIALQHMRVGDSAQVIVPYGLAYGASTSSGLLPYSTLVFDIKLKDIPFYEVRP